MRSVMLPCSLLVVAASAVWGQVKPAAPAPKQPAVQTMAHPTELQWGPAPAVFPKGAEMAVVSGDPGKPGPFVIELRMPDGYRIQPHFHPTAETVEVKQGTFLFAMGDTFDLAKTKPMHVGETGTIPATMHHFATAQGLTIVAVTSTGPFALTYVNPADDPTHTPKP